MATCVCGAYYEVDDRLTGSTYSMLCEECNGLPNELHSINVYEVSEEDDLYEIKELDFNNGVIYDNQ